MRVWTSYMLAVLLAAVPGAPVAGQEAMEGVVEVPLRMNGGRLVVDVQGPDGRTHPFALSTGSAVTVLSESGARALADADRLTLAGLPVPMDGFETVPDESLTVDGRVLAGLVSSNVLSRYDLLIDAPAGRLYLKPVGPEVRWPGRTLSDPVRLRVYHGVVLGLDVELNGTRFPAMLELGTPGVLGNQAALRAARVEGGRGALRVGTRVFTGVEVGVTEHPVVQRFDPAGNGFVLVGGSLAADCVLAVSFAHQELRTCVP